ncbi:hypothetical protein ACFSO7_07340 [Bacillus sp. CGMCC 1.16607]|uniref:hypothetical protein n=1 Tax=Bacillus sp. CGMCC 1.16607 TaxID=3351842 RepID=UPI003632BC0C
MRKVNKYVLLLTILPWLSAPFIGMKTFKRFLPGVLFMAVYVFIEGMVAEKKKWWWFPFHIKPNVLGELPLIVGAFFVGSFWILKFTYGKFKNYIIINLIIDTIFTYIIVGLLKKIGYVSLVRLNKFQLSLLFMVKSIVMYGFQFFYEKYIPHKEKINPSE